VFHSISLLSIESVSAPAHFILTANGVILAIPDKTSGHMDAKAALLAFPAGSKVTLFSFHMRICVGIIYLSLLLRTAQREKEHEIL